MLPARYLESVVHYLPNNDHSISLVWLAIPHPNLQDPLMSAMIALTLHLLYLHYNILYIV